MDTYLDDYVIPGFGSAFPVYFRVLTLVAVGFWAWGSNLHLMRAVGIDVPALFGTAHDEFMTHREMYALAATFSAVVGGSLWAFCEMIENGGNARLPAALCYALVVSMLVSPANVLHRRHRFQFLRALRRVFFGGLRQEVYFADVILADTLTSFAKVLGDLYTSLSILFIANDADILSAARRDSDGRLAQEHYHWMLVPLLVSVPYICRLRQCLAEFFQSSTMNKRHLANAIKYSTALPVIFLSALQKSAKVNAAVPSDVPAGEPAALPVDTVDSGTLTEDAVLWMWVMAVLVNSAYSFYWDICVDWDLGYLSSMRKRKSPASDAEPTSAIADFPADEEREKGADYADLSYRHRSRRHHGRSPLSATADFPPFLRPILHFSNPLVYYLAMLVDLSLRLTWSLKLSSHLHIFKAEGGVFVIELLEILRRWLWVYFRLEREWVSRGHNAAGIKIEMDQLSNPK